MSFFVYFVASYQDESTYTQNNIYIYIFYLFNFDSIDPKHNLILTKDNSYNTEVFSESQHKIIITA